MELLNNKEFLSKLIGKTLQFEITYKRMCKCCGNYDDDYTTVKVDVDFSSDMDGFSFYYKNNEETIELKNWIELIGFIIQLTRNVDSDYDYDVSCIEFEIFDKYYATYDLAGIKRNETKYSYSEINDDYDCVVYDCNYDSIGFDQAIIDFISEKNLNGGKI